MYVPEHFRESRPDALHDFIRHHSFGTLVSVLDGAPFATHLPFLVDASRGPHGTLLGHMARANPHWRAFAGANGAGAGAKSTETPESLVTFLGPHAYISPSWYETPISVPTWNYATVHAYGRPRIVHDTAAVVTLLTRTVDLYESGFERPWKLDGLPADYVDKMTANIVAFEIELTRLEGKLKLSQNRSAADRRSVIGALQVGAGPDGTALAEMMALHSPPERGTT